MQSSPKADRIIIGGTDCTDRIREAAESAPPLTPARAAFLKAIFKGAIKPQSADVRDAA